MADNKFELLLKELAENGNIDQDALDRITEASKGSPLRKDIDALTKRAEAAEQQAKSLRDGAIKAQLAKHELKLNPKALSLPDDLDVADDKAMKAWLIEAGAIEDTEQVQIDAELDQHERTAAAAATATTARTTGALTPEIAAGWDPDRWMRFEKEHPEAADRILRGEEVTGVAF